MPPKKILLPVQTKSLGDILQEKRKELGLSLETISSETKIKMQYLKDLEIGDYTNFSSNTHVKGFLKNYAQALGLDTEKVLALYRRETTVSQENTVSPQGTFGKFSSFSFASRRRLAIAISLAVVALLIIYVVAQVALLLQPPRLQIDSPIVAGAGDNIELPVTEESIVVTGATSPQTLVRLNSQLLPVRADNTFASEQIPISNKQVVLVITATNQFGKESQITIRLSKVQPQEENESQ